MQIKWLFFLISIAGISISSWLGSSAVVRAESIPSLETKGSIGFYGTYESENKPQPVPPDGVSPTPPNLPSCGNIPQEGSIFPQLGQLMTYNWIWISFLLLGVFLFRRKQTNIDTMYKN